MRNAVNWRFSLNNIRAANDAVVKAMDAMELPNLYRRDIEQLHTASDGDRDGLPNVLVEVRVRADRPCQGIEQDTVFRFPGATMVVA